MAASDLMNSLYPLAAKYDEMIALGWATSADKADGLAQEAHFEANRTQFNQLYPGKWVAVANLQPYVADTVSEAELAAEAAQPGRQFYVEGIPPTGLELMIHG